MFQHETRTVIKKAQQLEFQRSTAILHQPAHPPSSQAIGLFNAAYAGGVYFDYLPLMRLQNDRPVVLEKSFEAVALAYLAREQHRGDLRRQAHESYGAALSQINDCLRVRPATTPETLASVLLLALFVAISSGASRESRESWSIHVQGALAMLASDVSSELLQSLTGQYLVHHIVSVVQLDCIYRRIPLPPQLSLLYSASWLNQGPQAVLWSLLDRLATLNAEALESQGSLLHIAQLQELETDIQDLVASMPRAYPDAFAFEEPASHDKTPSGTLEIPCHVFQSHRAAQAWNTLRSMCLFTSGLLISAIDSYFASHAFITDEKLADSLRQSKQQTIQIAKAASTYICASVPLVLRPGCLSDDPDMKIRYSAWARSLMWPLSVAKESRLPKELRGYIDEQLHVLKAVLGMQGPKQEASLSPTLNDW